VTLQDPGIHDRSPQRYQQENAQESR
jgi:hypothetical protein